MSDIEQVSQTDLFAIAVGDIVEISLPGPNYLKDTNDRKEKRIVTVSALIETERFYTNDIKRLPIIQWAPVNEDDIGFEYDTFMQTQCNACFITRIVQKAKYSGLSRKEQFAIRVGDIVEIALPGSEYFSNSNDRKPKRIVTVLKVTQADFLFMGNSIGTPIIEWAAEKEDNIGSGDQIVISPECNTAFITQIIKKAKYVLDKNYIQNSKYSTEKRYDLGERKGNKVLAPMKFIARNIIASDPDLRIAYGVNEARLDDLWHKDGYPGLKGYSGYKGQITVTRARWQTEVIDIKKFKKWLNRNISKIIRTKKEYIKDLQRAEEMENNYMSEETTLSDFRELEQIDEKNENQYDQHPDHDFDHLNDY